jgi:hypothetical protein
VGTFHFPIRQEQRHGDAEAHFDNFGIAKNGPAKDTANDRSAGYRNGNQQKSPADQRGEG